MNDNLNTPVAFFQNRELIIALALQTEDGSWHGVDERGNAFIHHASRLVVKGWTIVTQQEAGEYLAAFRKETVIAISKLKELIPTILAAGPANLEEVVARLHIQANSELFAVYLILVENPELYHHKNGIFRLNTHEEQIQIRAASNAKLARQEFLEEVRGFIDGKKLSATAQYRLYEELPQLVQESGAKDLQRVIAAAYPSQNMTDAVQELRRKCGELGPDTDPIVALSGIPVGFADLVLEERLLPLRTEKGTVTVFSIDDEETQDFDDAISFACIQDGYRLGIHVSNVASRIDPQGYLHHEASKRGASFYAVSGVVPMLPGKYSEHEFSLQQGTMRPVISMYLHFDDRGILQSRSLKSEVVAVESNLSYRQVDRQSHIEPFATIIRFCIAHRATREGDLPGDKQRYYYYFRMAGGELQLKVIDNASPSRMMVEELMIMFNSGMAEIAGQNALPVLYRNVNRYNGTNDESYPSQAYLSTKAEFHPGIGCASYLHATSPIRRYTDLLNHYQILSLIEGSAAPFCEADLLEKIDPIEKKLMLLKELNHRSDRYWCLKYIESKYLYEPLDVILRGAIRDLIRLEIIPWGKQILAKCDHYPRGDEFKIAVHAIDWEKGIVKADIL